MKNSLSQRLIIIALAFSLLVLPFFHGPFLFDPYTETKWLLLNGVGGFLGLIFLFKKDNELLAPQLNRHIGLLLSLLFLSALIATVFNFPGAYREQIVDWATFLFLSFASYHVAAKKRENQPLLFVANAVGSLPVVFLSLLQFYGIAHQFGIEDRGFPFSSFGQQNLLSEYLVLSALMGIYGAYCLLRWRWLCLVSATLNLATLSLQYSRAATLAFVVSIAVLFLRHRALRKPIIRVLGLSAILILPLSFSPRFPYPTPWKKIDLGLQETKSINSRTRIIRWQNTLCMVKENPLGVGLGNYEYGYIPYQSCVGTDPESNPSMVVRSPHNGYLELAAEGGLVGLLALTILLALFVSYLLLIPQAIASAPWGAILILLAADAVFAFPLENAVPFFFAALSLGHYLALQPTGKIISLGGLSRFALGCLLLPLVLGISQRLYSKIIEASPTASLSMRQIACRLYPDNWRGCLQAIEMSLNQGNETEAKSLALLSVRERKNLYPAMRYLALIEAQQGNVASACQWTKRYESLTQPKASSLPEECASLDQDGKF